MATIYGVWFAQKVNGLTDTTTYPAVERLPKKHGRWKLELSEDTYVNEDLTDVLGILKNWNTLAFWLKLLNFRLNCGSVSLT